jgi:hypothetical protein
MRLRPGDLTLIFSYACHDIYDTTFFAVNIALCCHERRFRATPLSMSFQHSATLIFAMPRFRRVAPSR